MIKSARRPAPPRRSGGSFLLGVFVGIILGLGIALGVAFYLNKTCLLYTSLEVNARAVTDYLNAQIEAGAQIAMLFDTWGGSLDAAGYEEFSLAYMRRILGALRPVPTILFTKGGGDWLEGMAASGCSAIGLDWTVDPRAARRRVGNSVALQGNLDPAVLTQPEAVVRSEARRVLDAFGLAPGHVFNLGHGISPQASPDAVAALVDEVRAYSARTGA